MIADLIRPLGKKLRTVRPGNAALAGSKLSGWLPFSIKVTSPSFDDMQPMPVRFTAYGEGVFPALRWTGVPDGTASLALMVEDPDAPFPRPMVHAIVHSIPPGLDGLEEGEVPFRLPGFAPRGFGCGRNSVARPGWMPPSPPPGHGVHRYVFQLWAVRTMPEYPYPPGRTMLMQAIRPFVLAQGRLAGTYERA